MAVVTCDNERCKKDFPIKLRKKKHTASIIETYFLCPHCKTRYSSHVTDQDIRKRQRDMRKYQEELGKAAKDMVAERITSEEYDKTVAFIEKKKIELKTLVDELRVSYDSKKR